MGKKVGTIDKKFKAKLKNKKWRKKHPLCYIDKTGHAMAVPVSRSKGGRVKKGRVPKRKHVKLGGTVLSKKLLATRKALKKIFYITKAGSIMETKSGLRSKKRRKKVRRKVARKRTARSRRCKTFRSTGRLKAAMACVRAGRGSSKASKKVWNSAVRRCRKSPKGRVFLAKKRIRKLARHSGKIA